MNHVEYGDKDDPSGVC